MKALNKDQTKKFEELVKPVMEFLSQGTIFHPHISIIITSTNAEIVEGIQNFVIELPDCAHNFDREYRNGQWVCYGCDQPIDM